MGGSTIAPEMMKPLLTMGLAYAFYAAFLANTAAPQRADVRLRACVSAGEALPTDIGRRWRERYEELARFGAPQIATALGILADPASHPVVFHCTVGKDRTGVVVAVTRSASCRTTAPRPPRAS